MIAASVAAVQSTSLIVSPDCFVVNVQPVIGSTETVSNFGSWIASFVVLAVALSVGTWKVRTATSAPGSVSSLLTETCADADPASRNTPSRTVVNATRNSGMRFNDRPFTSEDHVRCRWMSAVTASKVDEVTTRSMTQSPETGRSTPPEV